MKLTRRLLEQMIREEMSSSKQQKSDTSGKNLLLFVQMYNELGDELVQQIFELVDVHTYEGLSHKFRKMVYDIGEDKLDKARTHIKKIQQKAPNLQGIKQIASTLHDALGRYDGLKKTPNTRALRDI